MIVHPLFAAKTRLDGHDFGIYLNAFVMHPVSMLKHCISDIATHSVILPIALRRLRTSGGATEG